MRRSGLVVGVTVAALLVAVVVVRDDTAAEDADLAVGLRQPPPDPSEAAGSGVVLLDANGVPGLRLGATDVGGADDAADTPAGCRLVRSDLGDSTGSAVTVDQVVWETSGWVVDEEVVSVFVGAWGESSSPSQLLRTWLGPTIGSPIEAAEELAGATTVTERPFGFDGPPVTVVTVTGRGVEVVYSDLPPYGGSDLSDGTARISTVEVRRPGGRVCSLSDLELPPPGEPPPSGLVVDADGVGPFRLGTPVADLVGVAGVVEDDTGERLTTDEGAVVSCRFFALPPAPGSPGLVRALVLDGVVTAVEVYDPGASTTFGLPVGADSDDVHELFPETTDRPDPTGGRGPIVLDVAGTTVELQMLPARAWLPDLERPVEGGASTVVGIVLRTPGTLQNAC